MRPELPKVHFHFDVEPPPPEPVRRAIEVASTDPDLVDRVEDPRFSAFGALAGVARNALSMLRGADPGDPETERHLCTGIARRAVAVLAAALGRGELPGVTAVRELERRTVEGRDDALTAYHTAVELTLDSGARVVLDWHATLDVDAPEVATPQTF